MGLLIVVGFGAEMGVSAGFEVDLAGFPRHPENVRLFARD
jgi:hypothetical protein